MAMDYFIGSCILLLVTSAIVNVLALGAFWITPGLRTISNRFVINLLAVNLVGCLALVPLLAISGLAPHTTVHQDNVSSIATASESLQLSTVESMTDDVKNVTVYNVRTLYDRRYWTLDFTVALTAMSVLLIVGDTWCAITDPLRYHSHMSSTKSWVLIIGVWCTGLLFGMLSVMRIQMDPQTMLHDAGDLMLGRPVFTRQIIPVNVFGRLFSYCYFTVIIMLPIVLVCGMYWRIFSEARDNGLRVRKNGSSPLLQSALNLAPAVTSATIMSTMPAGANGVAPPPPPPQQQPHQPTTNVVKPTSPAPYTGGLTMKIDCDIGDNSHTVPHNNNTNQPNLNADYMKPLIPTAKKQPSCSLEIPPSHNVHNSKQNILLTLSRANENPMRRNNSARQLLLLENAERHLGIRQVHSTPNLQKFAGHEQSAYILPLPPVHTPAKALSYITSIRHRLSNASSLFKYREESRTARISVMVVIMFVISYLPYGIIVLLPSLDNTALAICCMMVGNLSSPFIFAYRNKRVRRGVRRLFGIDKQTNERMQKRRITIRCKTPAARRVKQLTHQQSAPAVVSVQRSVSKVSSYSTNSTNRFFSRNPTGHGTFVVEIEKPTEATDAGQTTCQVPAVCKKSILKRVCGNPRTWGCTSDPCTTDSNECVDV